MTTITLALPLTTDEINARKKLAQRSEFNIRTLLAVLTVGIILFMYLLYENKGGVYEFHYQIFLGIYFISLSAIALINAFSNNASLWWLFGMPSLESIDYDPLPDRYYEQVLIWKNKNSTVAQYIKDVAENNRELMNFEYDLIKNYINKCVLADHINGVIEEPDFKEIKYRVFDYKK